MAAALDESIETREKVGHHASTSPNTKARHEHKAREEQPPYPSASTIKRAHPAYFQSARHRHQCRERSGHHRGSHRCRASGLIPGSQRQPRNRLRADIVAAGYGAKRFAVHVAASDRFLLLVRGESGLAPEFDAPGLGVGAAPCGAVEDTAAFELRGNAKDRKNDLGKIRGRIEERLGQRTDASPGLLYL